jgi:hypothetical protein
MAISAEGFFLNSVEGDLKYVLSSNLFAFSTQSWLLYRQNNYDYCSQDFYVVNNVHLGHVDKKGQYSFFAGKKQIITEEEYKEKFTQCKNDPKKLYKFRSQYTWLYCNDPDKPYTYDVNIGDLHRMVQRVVIKL